MASEERLLRTLRTHAVLVWPDTSSDRIESAREAAKEALVSEYPRVVVEGYKLLALANKAELELARRVELLHRTGRDTWIGGFLGSIGFI
jgi:hypothetical protein